MAQILGWLGAEQARASRRKRSRANGVAKRSGSTLMAIFRPVGCPDRNTPHPCRRRQAAQEFRKSRVCRRPKGHKAQLILIDQELARYGSRGTRKDPTWIASDPAGPPVDAPRTFSSRSPAVPMRKRGTFKRVRGSEYWVLAYALQSVGWPSAAQRSLRSIRFARLARELIAPFRTGVLIATLHCATPARCGARVWCTHFSLGITQTF
jgi:hypothetical protein